jgi:hypothetical protein
VFWPPLRWRGCKHAPRAPPQPAQGNPPVQQGQGKGRAASRRKVKAVDRCGINLDAGMPLWRTTQDVGVFQNILDTAPRNPCRPRRGRPLRSAYHRSWPRSSIVYFDTDPTLLPAALCQFGRKIRHRMTLGGLDVEIAIPDDVRGWHAKSAQGVLGVLLPATPHRRTDLSRH